MASLAGRIVIGGAFADFFIYPPVGGFLGTALGCDEGGALLPGAALRSDDGAVADRFRMEVTHHAHAPAEGGRSGSSNRLTGPDFAIGLPSFEFGEALDHGMVQELEPFGRGWHTVLRAETDPDGLGFRPGEKYGP